MNQSRTSAVSGSVSCQVPNGDLPIIGIQAGAFPRRVLIDAADGGGRAADRGRAAGLEELQRADVDLEGLRLRRCAK